MKAMATPAQNRKRDHEGTPRAAEQFAASLNRYKKALSAHLAGDAAYDHWTPEEVAKLEGAIAEKSAWLDTNVSKIRATLKTKDLPIKAAAFFSEQQVYKYLTQICMSLYYFHTAFNFHGAWETTSVFAEYLREKGTDI